MKNNLEWYRHKTESHQHWKFKMLRVLWEETFGTDGWAAEGRFWALNNMIADSDLCLLDCNIPIKRLSYASDLGLSPDKFNKFLHMLEECQLIQWQNGYIKTDDVQDCLAATQEKREGSAERTRKWRQKLAVTQDKHVTLKSDASQIESSTLQQRSASVTNQQSSSKSSSKSKSDPLNPPKNDSAGVGVNGHASLNGNRPAAATQKEKVALKRKSTEAIPFWEPIKIVFDQTYEFLKGRPYEWKKSQGNQNNASMADIIETLKAEAERQCLEWTEENAVTISKDFFNKSFSHDWLKKNYSLKNVVAKINEVLAIQTFGVTGTEIVKQHDHLFNASKEIYVTWYKDRNQVEPLISTWDEERLRLLIPELRSRSKSDEEYLAGWKTIFANWNKLEPFLRDRMDLRDIYINLNKIILQIKTNKNANGHSATKNGNADKGERYEGITTESVYHSIRERFSSSKTD